MLQLFLGFLQNSAPGGNSGPLKQIITYRIIAECMGYCNGNFLIIWGQGRPHGIVRTAGRAAIRGDKVLAIGWFGGDNAASYAAGPGVVLVWPGCAYGVF